jgi:hypothetical protein
VTATTYTPNPSTVLPGQVVGAPISHLPWVFVCCQGEIHCGWARAANTPKQAMERMKEKRAHEQRCKGGLVVIGTGSDRK